MPSCPTFFNKESQISRNSFFAKFLRFIGIVLMALTGGFTLLGGIGTTCAALFPTKYESMAALAPFQWDGVNYADAFNTSMTILGCGD